MTKQIKASASMNSSYNGNAFHNDLTNKDLLEIDLELSKQNLYFIYTENGFEAITPSVHEQNFFNHELSVYAELYSDEIQRIADNYRADRHDKKADELLEHGLYNWVRGTKNKKGEWAGKYRPRETILEWGNMELKDKQPTPQEYSAMIHEMTEWERSFNTENAKIIPLNFAIHVGERGGIHVHKRDTYCYCEGGIWKTGNLTECLKNMGIKTPASTVNLIPDFSDISNLKLRQQAEKTFQRYNNETAQWDKMRREKWHEILEAHGYQVATTLEPRPSVEELYEMIKAKYRDGEDVTISKQEGKTIQQYKHDRIIEKSKQLDDEKKAFDARAEFIAESMMIQHKEYERDYQKRKSENDKRESDLIQREVDLQAEYENRLKEAEAKLRSKLQAEYDIKKKDLDEKIEKEKILLQEEYEQKTSNEFKKMKESMNKYKAKYKNEKEAEFQQLQDKLEAQNAIILEEALTEQVSNIKEYRQYIRSRSSNIVNNENDNRNLFLGL